MDRKRPLSSPSPAPVEKASKPARETDHPFLPIEVWTDILLKIPAEDLVKLKIVCKSWHELITNQSFARSHLDHWRSRRTDGFAIDMCHMSKFLIRSILYFTLHLSRDGGVKLQCRDFLMKDCDGDLTETKPRKEYRLLASCDGLLLIGYAEETHIQLLICNPITGSRRRLPRILDIQPPNARYLHLWSTLERYEWAMVSSSSSYKIFGMSVFSNSWRTCYIFELPRLRGGGEELSRESWRALDVSLPLKGRICASTTAEGKVHWLAETSRPPGLKLLSIDVSTDELSTSALVGFIPRTDDWFMWDGTFYLTKQRDESRLWVLENLDEQPAWVEKDRSDWPWPCSPWYLPISTEEFAEPEEEGDELFMDLNSLLFDGKLEATDFGCSKCLKCWNAQKIVSHVNSLVGCD